MARPLGQIKVAANLLHLLLERRPTNPRLLLQQLDQGHVPFTQPLGHHLMIRAAKQAIAVVALPGRHHAVAMDGKGERKQLQGRIEPEQTLRRHLLPRHNLRHHPFINLDTEAGPLILQQRQPLLGPVEGPLAVTMLHIADKLGGDMVKLGGIGAVVDDKALHQLRSVYRCPVAVGERKGALQHRRHIGAHAAGILAGDAILRQPHPACQPGGLLLHPLWGHFGRSDQ